MGVRLELKSVVGIQRYLCVMFDCLVMVLMVSLGSERERRERSGRDMALIYCGTVVLWKRRLLGGNGRRVWWWSTTYEVCLMDGSLHARIITVPLPIPAKQAHASIEQMVSSSQRIGSARPSSIRESGVWYG